MNTINESRDLDSRDVLQSLAQAQGLVEVLGRTLTSSMPLDGRARDGLPILLDLLAVTLARVEQKLSE